MEDKIEKFKKLVVEGDFTSIKEKYPSKLMDKAYTYIGKKCEEWEKVVKEKYQVKKCKIKEEKKKKVYIEQDFSRKRIRVSTSDSDERDEEDDPLDIKKSIKLETALKKNKDHLKSFEHGKKKAKKGVKEVAKPVEEKGEEFHFDSNVNINDPTIPNCIIPRKVVPITNKYEVKEDRNYYFIPQAYNIFLSSYESIFPLFQSIKESSEQLLKEEKPINIKVVKIDNVIDIHNDLYKVTCEGNNIEIYYIDYLSTDLTVSPHLIPEKLYNKSMKYITKLFPHFYGDLICKPCPISTNIKGYFPISNTECEIYEGRIYHLEGNCLEQPFESVRVVWYDQNRISGKWIIAFFQLDNILSPWEIEISEEADRFKSLISIEHLPHHTPTILSITQTLMSNKYGPEGNVIFKSLIEDFPHYYEIIKHPLSFSEVLRKAEGSLYNSIDEYWKDLELIISNAKEFNQKERFEWRCADILECCVERFKWEYTAVDTTTTTTTVNNEKEFDYEEEATQRDVVPALIPIKNDLEESDRDNEEEEDKNDCDEKNDIDYEGDDTSDESQ